jgi:sterol desaturase/sphingolipid hydroxylase (fatty acid hydroxylase superfamily)
VTTVADVIGRRSETALDPDRNTERTETRATRRERQKVARRAAAIGGVTTVASVFASAAAVWGTATTTDALFKRRLTKDLGAGVIPLALAIVGWDFVYYWNHRFMHESRFMWAIHVVHHSSERYNLSVALRQPWADPLGVFVPYFVALFGVRPDLLETARGVNLLYQYWIHTDLVDRLGPFEKVLNTPSHHRVHHGMNPEYIDKNYGSILIIWDRLFGSFKIEADPVVYGLTKNIDSFNPATIAAHEYVEIGRDVARSTSWRERLAFTVRGPGWALTHRRAHASEARRISRAQALAPQR